jgi:hypothetical protein
VGALDLGGASTQIAFFVPDQDILANMFKLQIGGQKHWNVYVHSFLYFGANSALARLNQRMVAEAQAAGGGTATRASNPCYPSGYEEDLILNGTRFVIEGSRTNDFDECLASCLPLLRKVRRRVRGGRAKFILTTPVSAASLLSGHERVVRLCAQPPVLLCGRVPARPAPTRELRGLLWLRGLQGPVVLHRDAERQGVHGHAP